MSMMDVGMRLGDAIDPCHLVSGFGQIYLTVKYI